MSHETTMRSAYDRINKGDLSGFVALLADNFVEHEAVPGIPPTKSGVAEYFKLITSAFPDMNMAVEDVIASGDKAVARVTITGTHKGNFMGIAATNKRVSIKLIDIMQFDSAGLVCAHWGVTDMLTLMQQIGAVPAA